MSTTAEKIEILKRWWREGNTPLEAHTSGSTGLPKRIMLPRKLVLASARRSIRHFGLDRTSVVHLALSPDYIAGKMAVIRALEAGCNLTYEDASSHPLGQPDVPDDITLFSAVGSQIASMAALYNSGSLPHIRHLLLGGAPLDSAMRRAAVLLADEVWESYGMTETASHVALRRLDVCNPDTVSPFTVLPGINISLDPRGCLVVESEETGRLITNDLAEVYDNRNFRIIGRADNVIITGGLKVSPEVLEEKLRDIIPDREFYVASRHHPKWGNELVLVVVAPEVSGRRLIESCEYMCGGTPLSDLLREEFAPHERVRAVLLIPEIERTHTGKIKRNALKFLFGNNP